MRFAMYGAGAVNGYFGVKLALAGHEVAFVARGNTLKRLEQQGLRIESHGEILTLNPLQITDDPASIGAVDFVFVGVKTWQVPEVAAQLTPLIGEDTRVLTMQNGVEAPSEVASVVGEDLVLGGMIRGFFQANTPGVITHVGVEPSITFGQINDQRTQQALTLDETLSEAGIKSIWVSDIQIALWEKFVVVTGLGAVGAVTRSPIGPIRDYPPTAAMLRQVMEESIAVGVGLGVQLRESYLSDMLAFIDTFPPEATTSMQRDWEDGNPSELEAQIGAVVRLSERANIEVPLSRFIYDSLVLSERRARES